MDDKTLTVTVVGRRCVYINDYRVAGSKPYVSENLPSWSFEADINDLRYAIGRRPSSANKALQSRIEALEAALRKIAGGAKTGEEMFKERLGDRKSPTWFAVNVLQDSLAACRGTAERALESKP